MRAFFLGVATVGLICSVEAPAVSRPEHAVRSVQLIAMGAPVKQDVAAPAAPVRDLPDATLLPPVGDFRVHDLSRQWVEFQMANNFMDTHPRSAPADAEDPFAHVGVAQLGAMAVEAQLPPASSVPVPLWMRGGAMFASAAYHYVPGCSSPGYRPTGFLTSDAEMRRASYYDMMSNIACQYGIPVGLFDAMIIRESRYRPDAFSRKNAFGLTQLMPDTAVALGVNRYSINENLRGGAKYLRQQLDRFGHYHHALAAYNAGPGRIRNGLVPQIPETQAYVDNVLLNWSRLSGIGRQATIISTTAGPNTQLRPTIGRKASVSTF